MSQKLSVLRKFVAAFVVGCGLLLSAVAAQADDSPEVAAIRTLLSATQPDMAVADIKPSPVAGLYEVELDDGHAIYVSGDAKFLIPGDLYESRADGLVNLGEARRNVLRREKIAAVDKKDMIVFEAVGEPKATLTVFTDVDCPYCRKLHGEVEELNALGIEVHYLAYPREGLRGPTYTRMISTWCSDDRKVTMTQAKRGGDIPVVECDSPVEEEFQLGREVGVTGTPALVMENGMMLPGYVPAAELAGYVIAAKAQNDQQPK